MKIQVRECLDLACHFRFPQSADGEIVHQCPRCGGETKIAVAYKSEAGPASGYTNPRGKFDCHVLLDNLRSLLNVGTIFRTADGVGVSHMHLGGTTPTPEHPRFAKTALGAEHSVSWQYYTNGLQAALALKESGRRLIALESGAESDSVFQLLPKLDRSAPLLLIVGNEVAGIDPDILSICDEVVHLPMAGIKSSLNVAVAFGIGVYQIRYGQV